jgi:hypothetical protein
MAMVQLLRARFRVAPDLPIGVKVKPDGFSMPFCETKPI